METVRYFNNIEEIRKVCINFNTDLFNIKYFRLDNIKLNIDDTAIYPELYIIIEKDNNIVGVLKQTVLNTFIKEKPNIRFINYISINKLYKNQGYSKKLINEYFSLLDKNNLRELELSPFSKDGFYYLKNNLIKAANRFNIKLKYSNYINEF